MVNEIKDLVIIGAGPAGITAAVYAARKKLNFSVISEDIGGQAAWSGDIENYTGYQFITGPDLALKFREHLKTFSFDLQEGVSVLKIEKGTSNIQPPTSNFQIQTSNGKTIETKTIIIASGKRPKTLNVKGEKEYKNKGVTYCAICDGPLFANKVVAVVGGGNSALDAVHSMLNIASKIYVVNIAGDLTGDAVLIEKAKASNKVEILNNAKIVEIFGDKFVNGVKIERSGKISDLSVQGVFVEVGLIPNTQFIGLVKKNDLGEIVIDSDTNTSVNGIFAAGDVTNGFDKQIIIAAGEGAKAALAVFRYLSRN
ncbi:FAD-dependent oxidoreductase [Candidatus Saganbacteria bacterium]|nr:FAD-dependent oxidoreductase [Candidatus Saganbacteria bacterium]